MTHRGLGSRSCGFFLRTREVVEIIHGALGVRCGAENRPLAVFQDLEPRGDIGAVVLPDFRGDIEVHAKIGGPQLGNEFIADVVFIAEALAPEFQCVVSCARTAW